MADIAGMARYVDVAPASVKREELVGGFGTPCRLHCNLGRILWGVQRNPARFHLPYR